MPAVSKAQARLMNAVSHSSKFAKKVGIKRSVGTEFGVSGSAYKALPARKKNGKKR
jgi:hypothetical protein